MKSICLYFKVHQPYRLRDYRLHDIDIDHCYEDVIADKELINSMADECYLPTNEVFYNDLVEQEGKFRITFSVSGLVLELLQRYRPDGTYVTCHKTFENVWLITEHELHALLLTFSH